jgi:hypothetical protein
MFGISSNKDIENFVNKYLTTNQSILQNQFVLDNYININEHAKKKHQ